MITMRHYTDMPGFTEDYRKVLDFLLRINQDELVTPGFVWGRWEWMFSLPYLDVSGLHKIMVWEEDDQIVAVATYESNLGNAYFLVDKQYAFLKGEMLQKAKENLSVDGHLKALISDTDTNFRQIATNQGFAPIDDGECTAIYEIGEISYSLPQGYQVVSLCEVFDLHKYNRVLWRGFNHPGDAPETKEQLEDRRISLSGPNVNLNLNIAVVAPNGEFVSYCGMWYDPSTDYCLVEPVATDPDYRKMGLGKAAVLEGIKRSGKLGAKRALVGSSQEFYYRIGFVPFAKESWWEYSI